eukprot:Tbor_TRINITY_DN5579_c2_g10::TRINITY_DN5579_c2_g10_i1::g.12619::m.12619
MSMNNNNGNENIHNPSALRPPKVIDIMKIIKPSIPYQYTTDIINNDGAVTPTQLKPYSYMYTSTNDNTPAITLSEDINISSTEMSIMTEIDNNNNPSMQYDDYSDIDVKQMEETVQRLEERLAYKAIVSYSHIPTCPTVHSKLYRREYNNDNTLLYKDANKWAYKQWCESLVQSWVDSIDVLAIRFAEEAATERNKQLDMVLLQEAKEREGRRERAAETIDEGCFISDMTGVSDEMRDIMANIRQGVRDRYEAAQAAQRLQEDREVIELEVQVKHRAYWGHIKRHRCLNNHTT